MDGTDTGSAILRAAHVGALASLFGTLVFNTFVVRFPVGAAFVGAASADLIRRRLSRLTSISLLLALILGIAWLAARSAAIAGASGMRELLAAALPVVALETWFGRILLLRLFLLLALIPLWFVSANEARPDLANRDAGPRSSNGPARAGVLRRLAPPSAIVLAGAALALQAATSHIGAMEGRDGPSTDRRGAARRSRPGRGLGQPWPAADLSRQHARARRRPAPFRRFFPLGLVAVLVLAVTSLMQGIALVGSVPALVGTTYGRIALVKTLLFALLLALAGLNRLVMFSAGAQHRVCGAPIIGEAGIAVLVMLAAASLAHLTPGAHEPCSMAVRLAVQSQRSGTAVRPRLAEQFLCLADRLRRRRHRARGESVSNKLCFLSRRDRAGERAGRAVVAGRRTADQAAHRVAMEYSDGDLFRLVGHDQPLADSDRWDLIDYLRAHNTGEFVRTSGRGQFTLRIPRFNAVCANGEVIDQDDLRGKVLRLLVPGKPGRALVRPDVEIPLTTISLPAAAADRRDEVCCAAQYEAREAFAIVLGTSADDLAGSEFLVDANSWLRARWRPGEAGGWPSARLLVARVRALARSPLPADPSAPHVHGH